MAFSKTKHEGRHLLILVLVRFSLGLAFIVLLLLQDHVAVGIFWRRKGLDIPSHCPTAFDIVLLARHSDDF